MEEIRWWTWLLLASALIALLLLITGPLGHKYASLPLGQAISSTMVALVLAVCVLLAGAFMGFLANKQGLLVNRSYILVAMGLCLIPVAVMGVQLQKALTVPPIHDISTDTSNPPVFNMIVELRRGAPNPLTYGSENMPYDQLVKHQLETYPQVKSLQVDMGVGAALDRVEQILAEQDIAIVNRDNAKRIVEATATTFWFGFKDDVVVRVSPSAGGSLIDIRSVSRVGRSDLGTNAKRIEKILASF